MSVGRNVALEFNDINKLAEVAKSLGYTTMRNAHANDYYGRALTKEPCALVIKVRGGYDIGINKEGIVSDFHGGHTQRALEQIMPKYYENLLITRGRRVTQRTETKEEIHLKVTI